MVRNRIFGLLGNNHIFNYPIISYQRIKVYSVKTIYMGRYHWNDGVIRKLLISITTTVLIERDKILWEDSYYDLRSNVESYIE